MRCSRAGDEGYEVFVKVVDGIVGDNGPKRLDWTKNTRKKRLDSETNATRRVTMVAMCVQNRV